MTLTTVFGVLRMDPIGCAICARFVGRFVRTNSLEACASAGGEALDGREAAVVFTEFSVTS